MTARVRLSEIPEAALAEAVQEFNRRYGEMERVLWCLSHHARDFLLRQEAAPVIEELVWTIKSWWGVQGVRSDTKVAMSRALASFDWSSTDFEPVDWSAPAARVEAAARVAKLVFTTQSMGVNRREYSLASKVLHWLMPWRVPVYDSFVRHSLGVPDSWDHPEAYQRIVRELFDAAETTTAKNPGWVGELEPRSALRAFDKSLWWFGGGDAATAAEVRSPWRVVDRLGLARL